MSSTRNKNNLLPPLPTEVLAGISKKLEALKKEGTPRGLKKTKELEKVSSSKSSLLKPPAIHFPVEKRPVGALPALTKFR